MDIFKFFKQDLVLFSIENFAKITGNKKLLKDGAMLKDVYKQYDDAYDTYKFFIEEHWKYVNNKIYSVIDKLSDEEKIEFECDCKDIDWF